MGRPEVSINLRLVCHLQFFTHGKRLLPCCMVYICCDLAEKSNLSVIRFYQRLDTHIPRLWVLFIECVVVTCIRINWSADTV